MGWEVWCDGMEITQFTYFQQMAGFNCKPVSVEITYGLERICMFTQKEKNVYDLLWNDEGVKYHEVFHQAEKECKNLLNQKLPLPAYDQCLKASHIFNLLDARGVIAVAERTGYINRIRELAKGAGSGWLENQDK